MRTTVFILLLVWQTIPIFSQLLDRETVLQDERYIYNGLKTSEQYYNSSGLLEYKSSQFLFRDIKATCVGDFNNDGLNELGIIAVGNSINTQDYDSTKFQIHTMESKAYEVIDPDTSYSYYPNVHEQEGYEMPVTKFIKSIEEKEDSLGKTYMDTTWNILYPRTESNPIIRRYYQSHAWNYENFFAEAGNYAGNSDSNDEIVVLNRNSSASTLEITLFQNNNTSNQKWNYSFDKSTYSMPYSVLDNVNLQIDNLMYVLTEDFTSAMDNLILLSNDGTTLFIHRLQYNSSTNTWSLTYLSEHLQIEREKIKSAKYFKMSGSNNIALLYDEDPAQQQIFSLQGYNYSSSNIIYQCGKSNLDFEMLENVAAGDFNGDGDTQLALFINDDGSRAQKIYLMKKCDVCFYDYQFSLQYSTTNDLMMFNKNIMPFVEAVNYDYDVKGRDDLLCLYLEQDDNLHVIRNSPKQEMNSIIGWKSLPEFEENDYMLSVVSTDSTSQDSIPFLPIGPIAMRMISSSPTYLEDTYHKYGYYDDAYYVKMREVFNSVMPNRESFCDTYMEWGWHRRSYPMAGSTSDATYDFFINPDMGLKAYLDKAETFGYKVFPWLSNSQIHTYDAITLDDSATFKVKFNDFSDSGDLPEYIDKIVNNPDIINHTAVAAWFLSDESTNIPARTGTHPFYYKPHFERTINSDYPGPGMITQDFYRNINNNFFNVFREKSDCPVMMNLKASPSNIPYLGSLPEALGIDHYTYTNSFSASDSTIITSQRYGQFVRGYSKDLYNNMVRNDLEYGFHMIQAWDTWDSPVYDTNYTTNERIYESGKYEAPSASFFRWSLFGSTIQGLRGQFTFIYGGTKENNLIHSRMFNTLKEFNYYYDWFVTKSKKNFITTDCARYTYSQRDTRSNDANTKEIDTDMYINDDIPIIVTSYSRDNELHSWPVSHTAYLPGLSDGTVYLLSPDYWANGVYEIIPSNYDGNFVEFTDTLHGRDIRIYAVGTLPPWEKPNEWISGEFGNSNQQQLVAYPIEQHDQNDPGSIDTLVRYHTVYQRPDANTGFTNIYYRRSAPISSSLPQNLIEWEEEHLLSDRIYTTNSIGKVRNEYYSNCTICDRDLPLLSSCNPSLIVRWDEESRKPLVYIAFNTRLAPFEDIVHCQNNGAKAGTGTNIIAECKFSANEEVQIITPAFQIATYGGEFSEYGNPVINASAFGNYYSWADSQDGIVIAFKGTGKDNHCFKHEIDSLSLRALNDPYSVALHPSVNPYSRTTEGHNNVSVVWQEKPSGSSDNEYNIYYTRISNFSPVYNSNTHLQNYLTIDSCHAESHNIGLDYVKNILKLSTLWGTENHQFPVIYRGVELETEGWRRELDLHERIFWNSYDIPTENNTIGFAYIDYIDSYDSQYGYVPNCRTYLGPWHIRGINKNLRNPVVVQGKMNQINSDVPFNIDGDSLIVLNFVELKSPESNSTIWQINSSYFGLLYDNNYKLIQTDFTKFASEEYEGNFNSHRRRFAKPVIGYGNNPQLSAMPFMTGKHSWSLNRRLFQVGREPYTEIVPSYEHFAKATVEDETEHHLVGFAFKNDKLCVVSRIAIVNEETGDYQKLFYYPSVEQDTIYSSFFDINPDDDLVFYSHKDFDNNRVKLYLKLQGSEELIHIPVNKSINHQFTKLKYGFSDQLTKAQFVLVPKSPDYWIYKEMVLGGLPELDEETTTSPKMLFTDNDKTVLDVSSQAELFQVKAYPNPTFDGKMNLKIASNVTDQCLKSVVYQITDLNGKILDTFTANSADILHLDLGKYESNILIITAKTTDDCSNKTIESTVKVIVE